MNFLKYLFFLLSKSIKKDDLITNKQETIRNSSKNNKLKNEPNLKCYIITKSYKYITI